MKIKQLLNVWEDEDGVHIKVMDDSVMIIQTKSKIPTKEEIIVHTDIRLRNNKVELHGFGQIIVSPTGK